MPRRKRYTQFHSCHHVMLRGNAGRSIFLDDHDRIRFCLILQKITEEHLLTVHTFCFMSNHVHFILEPTITPLSASVHDFAGRYAQYFNRNSSTLCRLVKRARQSDDLLNHADKLLETALSLMEEKP